MAETNKPVRKPARGRDDQAYSIPAIRHVGRTLESDPKYQNYEGEEGENLTPEAQIANIGASPDTTMGRGATDLSADVSSTDDLSRARARNARPEPLKTRLPGDTSSDPHTDVGPDNATTVQHRGENRK